MTPRNSRSTARTFSRAAARSWTLPGSTSETHISRPSGGADASWPLHDSYGLPLERIPDVIAHTVELIIRDLRTHVTDDTPT